MRRTWSLRPEWRVQPEPAPAPAAAVAATDNWLSVAAFIAAHIPLAILMKARPDLGTVHAFGVLAIGLWWVGSAAPLPRIGTIAAYIAGAEVLWRMTGADVYWEFGKYATIGILLIALVRHRALKPPAIPLTYFILLLPSVTLTLTSEDWSTARSQLSFNLSGPLALMVCGWFFSKAQLAWADLEKLFVAALGPIIGIATLAAIGATSADLSYGLGSNLAASGGFGPNQVSAALGLGVTFAILVVLGRASNPVRGVMAICAVWLAVQSALTFSRGGLYMAAGAIGVAALLMMREARLRARLRPLVLGVFVAGNYLLVPYLVAMTDGAITSRFGDVYLTGRDRMIQADLEVWKEHPILGVGPGEGRAVRGGANFGAIPGRGGPSVAAAHTEFTRLVGEHGVFGLAALIILVVGGAVNIRRMPDARTQGVIGAVTCWSALFMLSDGMRIVAPSLLCGLGYAAMLAEDGSLWHRQTRRRVGIRPLVAGHPALAKDEAAPATT